MKKSYANNPELLESKIRIGIIKLNSVSLKRISEWDLVYSPQPFKPNESVIKKIFLFFVFILN